MTLFKRVGVDWTCDFDGTPDPEFWEPITPPAAPAAPTTPPAAAPEKSEG